MNLRTCLLTENDCYRRGKSIKPKGVLVHSTGANNPRLSRYVAPNDGLLGDPALRHWNQSGVGACPHAFIGRLANGGVATYQTLPWTMRGWHCGRAANNTHIAFEICEDGLTDPVYFAAVYREAVELTAYLCKTYGLDPLADGVVICHQEGYQRGIASNHGDVLHWFPRHGKSMDNFRADVAQELEDNMDEAKIRAIVRDEMAAWKGAVSPADDAECTVPVPILKKGSTGDAVKALQLLLVGYGYDLNGADGSFGPGTDKAVRAWQKDAGLDVDGSFGPASWARLLGGIR